MHKGLITLGIILILIGLAISFYRVPNVRYHFFDLKEYLETYPFTFIGIILFLAGVLSLMLGALYSFGKTERNTIYK